MGLPEEIEALQPGQSILIGKSWDGEYYVVRTQTTAGSFLGPVKRTIGTYSPDFEEAYNSAQKEHR